MEYSEYEKIKKQTHRQKITCGCLVRRRGRASKERWGSGKVQIPTQKIYCMQKWVHNTVFL